MSDRWFKVQTSIVRNEKVLQLTRTQRWALIELWAAAAEDLNDGVISRTYCDKIVGKRMRNVMIEHGFLHWIEVDKTLQIHDYLNHQRSREEVLSVSEKRRQAGRRGGKAKAERAKQAAEVASNLPDDTASNELGDRSSKILPDPDPDLETYLRKSPTSPSETRANEQTAVAENGTAGALALVPSLPEQLPDRMPNGRRIPARTRHQMLANLNATSRSAEADKFVTAFAGSLDGRLDRRTRAEVAQVVDELLRDQIPPQQIADGLAAWQASDSWSPTQIRRFVAKAARGARPTTGKPTAAILESERLAAQLHEENDR